MVGSPGPISELQFILRGATDRGNRYEAWSRWEADFEILGDQRVIHAEIYNPIELALSLRDWLGSDDEEWEYLSVDGQVPALWLRRLDGEWRFGTDLPEGDPPRTLAVLESPDTLRAAATHYIANGAPAALELHAAFQCAGSRARDQLLPDLVESFRSAIGDAAVDRLQQMLKDEPLDALVELSWEIVNRGATITGAQYASILALLEGSPDARLLPERLDERIQRGSTPHQ